MTFVKIYAIVSIVKTNELKNIAKIRLGYTFRERIGVVPEGNLSVIQQKDLSCFEPIKIEGAKIPLSHLLKKGEVLLSNRGLFRALLFDNNEATIVSNAFFVITVTDKNILPEYLSVFLNSALGQKEMNRKQETTTTPSLTRTHVEQIKIPDISLEKQKKLVEFAKLQKTEYNIMQRLSVLREQYLNLMIKGELNG